MNLHLGHRRSGDDQPEMDPESRRCFEGAVVAFLCGLLAICLMTLCIAWAAFGRRIPWLD